MVPWLRKRGGAEPPKPVRIVMPPPPPPTVVETEDDPTADEVTDEHPYRAGPAIYGLAGHPTHAPPVATPPTSTTPLPPDTPEIIPMTSPADPSPPPRSMRGGLGILLGLGLAAAVMVSFSEHKWRRDNEPTTPESVVAAPETVPEAVAAPEPEEPPPQAPVIAASPAPNTAAPVATPATPIEPPPPDPAPAPPAAALPPPTPAAVVPPPPKPTTQATPTSLRVSSMGPSPSCKADCDWGDLAESGFPKTSPQKTRTVVCGNELWIASAWVAEGDGSDAYKRCYTATGLTSADPDGP